MPPAISNGIEDGIRTFARQIHNFDMYDAVLDADVLMLVTEWKEFRLPSWAVIKKTMSRQIVLDGRNIYDKKEMEELGFIYHCIGK